MRVCVFMCVYVCLSVQKFRKVVEVWYEHFIILDRGNEFATWKKALLQSVRFVQVAKKYSTFYRTPKYVAVTRTRH